MTRLAVLNNVSTKAMLFGLAFALALGDFSLIYHPQQTGRLIYPYIPHVLVTSLIGPHSLWGPINLTGLAHRHEKLAFSRRYA